MPAMSNVFGWDANGCFALNIQASLFQMSLTQPFINGVLPTALIIELYEQSSFLNAQGANIAVRDSNGQNIGQTVYQNGLSGLTEFVIPLSSDSSLLPPYKVWFMNDSIPGDLRIKNMKYI